MSLSTEKRTEIGSITRRYGLSYGDCGENRIIIKGGRLPFDYLGSIEGRIAKKCTQEFKVELERYDFGRDGDDWDLRFLFVVKCGIGNEEIEVVCERIRSAEDKFSKLCDRLVQIAFNSLST